MSQVQEMEEKYNFAIDEYIEQKRKKDNLLHKWVIGLLFVFGILLSIHIIFDYNNEMKRKKRADANQVEYEKSLKLLGIDYKYSDTLYVGKPKR